MFKSFAVAVLAAVTTARRMPQYKAKPVYRAEYENSYESEVPYSTSYNAPAKTSCYIAPYKPETIHRAKLGTAKRDVGQYRSVNWGKDGCYSDWRDIDVLNQPAAYEKPSFTTSLVSPNQVYNSYENSGAYTEHGGYGGAKRRSDGINYNKQVYKRTSCNGLRKDTLSTEYEHTDAPSTCVSQYVAPKPYQCYEAPKDYRTVKGVRGVAKTGYDKPLEYPSYTSKSYHYEKPVYQAYEVSQTCKHNPYYVDYEAPHYDFMEYDVKPQEKILPTYYKAPEVYGEESYGYYPESYDNHYEERSYPVGKKGAEYNDYYAEPMKVRPRYPTKEVQTYDKNVVQRTKLQPSQYKSEDVHYDLVPKYEKAQYHKPRYAPERPKYERQATDLYEVDYAPKSKHVAYKKSYGAPKYEAVKTNYYPTATKAPYGKVDYGCQSCQAHY